MYRLHIIPVNLKNTSHKLFSLQNPNLSSDTMTELEFKDLLLNIKIPLCTTSDIFGIHSENDPFWSYEKKRFIRIMYYVSELQESVSEIIRLLRKNFCVDIFIDQAYQADVFDFLKKLSVHPANLRFIVIENQMAIQSQKSIFETIPSIFKSCIYFLYLPRNSVNKQFLPAAEVMARIEDRRRECQENKETLKIISITNNQVFTDEPHKKIFYLNPIPENYYKYQQHLRLSSVREDSESISSLDFYVLKSILTTQKLMSLFISLSLFIVWKLRHIYWNIEHLVTFGVPKVFSYFFGIIRVKFIKLFWVIYSFIANIGIFIQNTPGKIYKRFVESYWAFRKILSALFNLANVAYWQIRKILSYLKNLIVQLFWRSRIIISSLFNFCIQSYWSIRSSKYLRPFFKAYWFISFQLNKRIVSLFKRKKSKE